MTSYIVEGWDPLDGRRPVDDDQVFELLTAAVFQARFRPDVVRGRWPNIRHGFANFDLETVAAWPDEKLTELLAFEGMIRNLKKIRATLFNARDLLDRSRRFGNALAYLRSFGEDHEALVQDIDTWAHYIGAPSIRWFVQTAGCGAATTKKPVSTR
jgi:3-methyladenine DNA glycosylase Tag